jgi:hypothetical protein
MAAANIGYVPISDEETCKLMDERYDINLAMNALYKQFSTVDRQSEAAIQNDTKITEQLQNLFSRQEAIDVVLCKAGRSQDPRRKDVFTGICFSDKVKELAGARYIPMEEANKIGQSGLPAMPAGFIEDFVPHVWVWPEGHPFIVNYVPLHLNPAVDTDEE